jgi:hypothetical protein
MVHCYSNPYAAGHAVESSEAGKSKSRSTPAENRNSLCKPNEAKHFQLLLRHSVGVLRASTAGQPCHESVRKNNIRALFAKKRAVARPTLRLTLRSKGSLRMQKTNSYSVSQLAFEGFSLGQDCVFQGR